MYKFSVLNVVNIIYIGLCLVFIFFYFHDIRPEKIKDICAESAAKATLNLPKPSMIDAFDFYQEQNKKCISDKSAILNIY